MEWYKDPGKGNVEYCWQKFNGIAVKAPGASTQDIVFRNLSEFTQNWLKSCVVGISQIAS
jgi:hypothetical protein